MNRDRLKVELIRDEGVRLNVYRDSEGYFTIGIGHLLGTSPRMSTITEDECDALYQHDVGVAEKVARSLVPLFDKLTEEAQRALVNMTLNRGAGHMAESTTILPAILELSAGGPASKVRETMLASQWAKQVGRRANRLADLFDPQEHPQDEGFA